MIETTRLELRLFKISDCSDLKLLLSDQEVMQSSLSGTKTSQQVRDWLVRQIEASKCSNGIDTLAVTDKSSGSVMGYCGLSLTSNIDGKNEIEIGYRLIRQYWGYGFATEAASAIREYAFNELNLPRLVALIEPVNQRSIGVAEKIGMRFEKEVMLEGYTHPDYLYSICAGEFV